MEIYKNNLYTEQREKLKKLWETYGDSSTRTSYGNSALLKRLILEEDIEILSLITEDINFYTDIDSALIGEIIVIIMKSHTIL